MTAPTPFQVLHIPLDGSQDDKTARLSRGLGVMRRSINVDHSHAGEARKRRGTTRIPLTTTTHGETPEAVYVALGQDRDELVLVGHDYTYGVAANTSAVDGAALVRRGPSIRGQFEIGMVHGSAMGDEA